jgi:hypothetical protein
MNAIDKLAALKGMLPVQVVRQALRQYHAVALGACHLAWPPMGEANDLDQAAASEKRR